jgi:predicted Zn finger-like uncharacterized protein
MHTRCPHCQAVFRVTTADLGLSAGRVRCGECHRIFNGLEALTDLEADDDPGSASTNPPGPGPSPQGKRILNPNAFGVFKYEVPRGSVHAGPRDLVATLTDRDRGPDAAPKRAPLTPSAPPGRTRAERAAAAPGAREIEDESIEILVPPPTSPAAAPPSRPDRPGASAQHSAGAGIASPPGRPAAGEVPEGSGDTPMFIPAALRDDLLQVRGPRGDVPKDLAWAAGCLALILALFGQFVVHERAWLVQYAELEPGIRWFCERMGCDLPPLRDLDAFVLNSRNIHSHPDAEAALMVTATLENRAPFEQALPLLELTFTDLQGRPHARRRFSAREYLGPGQVETGTLAPGRSVTIRLELADPGPAAVGYEFRLL